MQTVAQSSAEFRPAPRARRRPGQLREGLRYVRTTPQLALPLLMIAIIGTLAWEFQVSLPLVAADTFHGGAGTYGAMTSVMGVGAVVGGLVSATLVVGLVSYPVLARLDRAGAATPAGNPAGYPASDAAADPARDADGNPVEDSAAANSVAAGF